MNIVNRLTSRKLYHVGDLISVAVGAWTALIAVAWLSSCTAGMSNIESTDISTSIDESRPIEIHINPANEKEACTIQAALAFAVNDNKAAGVPENETIESLDGFRQDVIKNGLDVPHWLFVRYNQIVHDVYRRDRDINAYGSQVYNECRVYQLYEGS